MRKTDRRFHVIDHDAVAACYDRVCGETALGLVGCANEAVRAMGHRLSGYGDDDVLRFVEGRRLAASRDAEGLAAWLDGIEGLASRLPKAAATEQDGGIQYRADMGFAMARIRYREFVEPRMHLEAGDEEALMAVPRA